MLSTSRLFTVERPDIEMRPLFSTPKARTESEVQRRRVSFDVREDVDHKDAEPEMKKMQIQSLFREPTDFSKPCHFRSQYLNSWIPDQEDGSKKQMNLSLISNSSLTMMASLDEFMKTESEMKDADDAPNDRTVLNFHKMLRIVKENLDDGNERRDVVKEMTSHRYDTPDWDSPFESRSRSNRETLGLQGPMTIRPVDVDSFWYYNVMTKEFVGEQRRAFQTNLDAVSL
jgi:hypothetical protein